MLNDIQKNVLENKEMRSLKINLRNSLIYISNKNKERSESQKNSLNDLNLICCFSNPLNFLIIDARYPYEYHAGHVNGSINIWNPFLIQQLFHTHSLLLKNRRVLERLKEKGEFTEDMIPELYKILFNNSKENSKQFPIVVFYCEFSSKRGPRLFKKVRSLDRIVNNYPKLNFPHIFVMKGGYQEFYRRFPSKCWPKDYLSMSCPKFSLLRSEYHERIKRSNKNKLLD